VSRWRPVIETAGVTVRGFGSGPESQRTQTQAIGAVPQRFLARGGSPRQA